MDLKRNYLSYGKGIYIFNVKYEDVTTIEIASPMKVLLLIKTKRVTVCVVILL